MKRRCWPTWWRWARRTSAAAMSGVVELLAFAGVMALGQFSPGPDMVLLTRTALAEGARHGVRMALGIGTGLGLHATIAIGGAAVLLQREAWLRETMRWLAVAYLLWLASRLIGPVFRKTKPAPEAEVARSGARSAYLRGLLCNLLNPKVVVFLAAVTAPFLAGERPEWWAPAMWAIVVGQGWALWSLWAVLLQWRPLREGYRRAGRTLDGLFGAALAVLAGVLALG